jgi:hypothetical protein
MGMINRGAIVVKPKQPFLDWLRALPEPVLDITLEELREDCSAYLLPDWDSEEKLQRMLSQCCADIFEEQLAAWFTDESQWPKKRAWAAFTEWFDVEPHSVVINLVQGALIDDEPDA